MKSFFNEYGKIIVTAVVAISLIAVSVALRVPVQNSLENMVSDWANSTASATLVIEEVNVGASGSGDSGSGATDIVNKGTIITIDNLDVKNDGTIDTFRVLSVSGNQAKVLAMDVYNNVNYGSNNTYSSSILDRIISGYYDVLPETIQSAIIEQNVNQSAYSSGSSPSGSENFSSWEKSDFTESTTSGSKYYLTKTTEVNVGNRKVYALDVDDVIAYLGPNSTPQDVNKLFFNTKNSVSRNVWLRSAKDGTTNYQFCIEGWRGFIRATLNESLDICPAFVIDLSQVNYSIVQ